MREGFRPAAWAVIAALVTSPVLAQPDRPAAPTQACDFKASPATPDELHRYGKGISREGNQWKFTRFVAGGSVGRDAKPEEVKAGLDSVCAARNAEAAQRTQQRVRDLARDLEVRVTQENVARYRALINDPAVRREDRAYLQNEFERAMARRVSDKMARQEKPDSLDTQALAALPQDRRQAIVKVAEDAEKLRQDRVRAEQVKASRSDDFDRGASRQEPPAVQAPPASRTAKCAGACAQFKQELAIIGKCVPGQVYTVFDQCGKAVKRLESSGCRYADCF